ncbi:MAG: ABC transporter substrate-binding protein [Firmicutes bacterium]|nr:ABC transporter substrate-binding protein [Bacillota bacterium]MCL2255688.1 ABC transporter substrate-binding protein [Bacillota bacterium]
MKKKLLAIVLAIVMAFAVGAFFVGCSDDFNRDNYIARDEVYTMLSRLEELNQAQLAAQMTVEQSRLEYERYVREYAGQLQAREDGRFWRRRQEDIVNFSANAETRAIQEEEQAERIEALPAEIIAARNTWIVAQDALLKAQEAFTNALNGNLEDLRPEQHVRVRNRFYENHLAQFENAGIIARGVRPTQYVYVVPNPQNVVVMCLAALDTMIALGLEDRVVGFAHLTAPSYIDEVFPRTGPNALPDVSMEYPHDPNYRMLVQLEVDLIIISGRQRTGRHSSNHFARLSQIAPTIDLGAYAGTDEFLESVFDNLETLAKIFGLEEKAQEMILTLNSEIARVNTIATELNLDVALLQLNAGRSVHAYGPNGRYSFVFREFGLTNALSGFPATEANHGMPVTAGTLVRDNVDVIFVIYRDRLDLERADNNVIANTILNHAMFQGMRAIQNEHVFALNSALWYLVQGGFNGLQIQVEEILTALETVAESL